MSFGDWAKAAAGAFSAYEKGTMDVGAPQRIVEQLGQWIGHLSRNATIHWGPNLVDPEVCCFCDEDAVMDCFACGDPICLAHAHVSHRAEGLCDECVEIAIRAREEKKRNRRKRRTSQQRPEERSSNSADQAFLILGVSPGDPWDKVQAAYKAAASANHPDRFQGQQKVQANARLKNINAAFSVLKEHYRRAA